MNFRTLRRAIESDLQEKFPSPNASQQQVIASVLGVLREAEQGRTGVADLGSWRDTSFLGVRVDSEQVDRPAPRHHRRDGYVPMTVDDVLDSLREKGWRPTKENL